MMDAQHRNTVHASAADIHNCTLPHILCVRHVCICQRVRSSWEQGAPVPRMDAIPSLDGNTMRSAAFTGQVNARHQKRGRIPQ
jgi:hypothetical protein